MPFLRESVQSIQKTAAETGKLLMAEAQLAGYEEVAARLGEPGAPQRAARLMVEKLKTY